MPRWRVLLHADSLEWLREDVWVAGGLYTTRFVEAASQTAAAAAGAAHLRLELVEQPFIRPGPDGEVRVLAEDTAEVSFFAGRFAGPGYAFYAEDDLDADDDAPQA
jgi:hypothetical protein